MKKVRITTVALAALAALAVVVTGALAAPAASGGAKVAVASTGLGRILVNSQGRTLYLFEKDTHGRSTCTGQCAQFWPPLVTTGKPRAGTGALAKLLGTVRRPDGRLQVTYNHHPLYSFAKDTKRGQTNGEGVKAFGAEWYAVSRGGTTVESKDDHGSDSGNDSSNDNSGGGSTSSGSGGYGY